MRIKWILYQWQFHILLIKINKFNRELNKYYNPKLWNIKKLNHFQIKKIYLDFYFEIQNKLLFLII